MRARLRLTPMVTWTSAILLVVAGILMSVYEERLYVGQRTRDIGVQAQILAASVTAALVFDDNQAAQEYVRALGVNPDVEAAGVYDDAGALVAGFTRPGSAPLPEQVEQRAQNFDRLNVAVPVEQDGNRLGTVYLRAITDSVQRRAARYGAIILLGIMAAFVLMVHETARRQLTRANTELEQQARDLADANTKLYSEIEEREKAEEALRQSQKMEAIGQLSGGIAHDFNNLLMIVKGNMQLMQRRVAQGRTDVSRYMDSAMEGLNRAANLTQRILAFSRRQPLSPNPVNLSALVGGMRELLRHSVGERVEIETHLDADWWTMCDANQMENVILNLAINARDAMPEGGKLVVETGNVRGWDVPGGVDGIPSGEYVRLRVRDTGVGMSEEVRRKAIDPFFTTKPQGQGTGLGLSMTFGYVRQSNGYMTIESAPFRGTTITILMPRHEVVAAPQAETQAAEAATGT